MRVAVYTLGCKVNSVESRSIMKKLTERGCEVFDNITFADDYVLNTCSVTAEADRKCRQTVGKIIKTNPDAKIYVIGCSSQRNPEAYTKYPNVVHICGNGKKMSVIDAIMSDITSETVVNVAELPSVYEEFAYPAHTKTREFIKIQDGCNNFCSYCIVPHLRGRERSRSIESIVAEAKAATSVCGEIVLTGINVSSYGRDIGVTLCDLFAELSKIRVRKRLSSLECNIVSYEFLDIMKRGGFCDHFHLSLQSGSNGVLKRMNRHYTAEQYFEKAEMIKNVFPNAGITTDIITGFQGETEAEFEETVLFCRAVGFSDMHIFPYSERAGTKAAGLPQIPMEIRRERAERLISVKEELKSEFLSKQPGKTLSVYVETDGEGYSTNYVKVYTDKEEGCICDVKINSLYKKGVK